MSIVSSLMNCISNFISRSSTSSPSQLNEMHDVFGNECALCDSKVDYSTLVVIEGDQVPVCGNCKTKLSHGVKWHTVLRSNYINEKRRYGNKYLRIVVWSSDDD